MVPRVSTWHGGLAAEHTSSHMPASKRNRHNQLPPPAATATHRDVMAREAMSCAAVSGMPSLSWSTRRLNTI